MMNEISNMTGTKQGEVESRFSGFYAPGGTEECYITIGSTSRTATLEQTLDALLVEYESCLGEHGLNDNTAAFTRFYFSDVVNQITEVKKSPLYARVSSGAVSCIEQMPLTGGIVAMLSYHVKPAAGPLQKAPGSHDSARSQSGTVIKGDNYSMHWSTNTGTPGTTDSGRQTAELFAALNMELSSQNLSLRNNTVRTWMYVRDIDNNYTGMVKARTPVFAQSGLTDKTRYVASTGIEGKAATPSSLVSMDALSIGGLQEQQIVRMEALENMPPTISYGVTFERGLRIRFGDRSHLHISGTASIDEQGKVMHVGDVEAQTRRTIDNIEALLAGQGATLSDMAYFILYLRNPNNFEMVENVLQERLPPGIPVMAVQGSVCRPAWLVELEGVAIIPDSTDFAPFM